LFASLKDASNNGKQSLFAQEPFMGLFDRIPAKQVLRLARELARGEHRADPTPAATAEVPAWTRPTPPDNANNYLIIILDSCRYDSFMKAKPKLMSKLGKVEKRYSYATWTAPSHYNLLMGLLPHTSPPNVYASEYYKEDFLRYSERLGFDGMEFAKMVPRLFLPSYLRNTVGYRTNALVSMPVLNPQTPINQDFDTFKLMESHNDMRAMFNDMRFYVERPSFFLLNVGETHYPYARPNEDTSNWPRIHGVNGVFKNLDKNLRDGQLVHASAAPKFFDAKKMKELHNRQVDTVQYIDSLFEELYDIVPKNTYITVTADHGELFGEKGYFGHGPILHNKVMEVPFVEGKIR